MNDKNNTCPVCGEETANMFGNYRKDNLCPNHSKDLKNGHLIFCNKCNKFHYEDNPCLTNNEFESLPKSGFKSCIICGNESNGKAFCYDCYSSMSNSELLEYINKFYVLHTSEKNTININNSRIKNSNCITCGAPTTNYLFCDECYNKYKNETLILQIKNCSSVEIIMDDYSGRYTCEDGHIVKSKSEKMIDEYLFNKQIQHGYEVPIRIGDNDDDKIYPDFKLPKYLNNTDVYIEHFGYLNNNSNEQYKNQMKKTNVQKYYV